MISNLSAHSIAPPVLMIPRILDFDLDNAVPQESTQVRAKSQTADSTLNVGQILKVNKPQFIMTELGALPHAVKEKGEISFVVNGLFGNEDNESIVRVKVYTKKVATIALCRQIIESYRQETASIIVTKANIKACVGLIYNGVLAADPSHF